MPLLCQVTQEPTSRSMLPIQANLSVSNCALLLPNSGSSAAGAPNTPSAVPSRGAALRDIVGGAHRARAGHVLHHDVRIAGNESRHVAREQPHVDVVAAAGVVADDDVDALALVEIGDCVGLRCRAHRQQCQAGDCRQNPPARCHCLRFLPRRCGRGMLRVAPFSQQGSEGATKTPPFNPSCPALCRASTSSAPGGAAVTSPAMTNSMT